MRGIFLLGFKLFFGCLLGILDRFFLFHGQSRFFLGFLLGLYFLAHLHSPLNKHYNLNSIPLHKQGKPPFDIIQSTKRILANNIFVALWASGNNMCRCTHQALHGFDVIAGGLR